MVVTFTNAAATEMRERILEKIYEKLDEEKENENLQKQIILLNKSNISTIHSFCLDVIRNNFYKIDISPNFRLADTAEIELLQLEILEKVFDDFYENEDEKFIHLVNIYGGYRDDEKLKEIIMKIYKFIQSTPFPEEWLDEQVSKFNLKEKLDEDFSNTEWGKILIKNAKEEICVAVNKLKNVEQKLRREDSLIKYLAIVQEDRDALEHLLELNKWDEIYNGFLNLKFGRWIKETKTDCDLKIEAKEERDMAKQILKPLQEKIFIYDSKQANEDIYAMYEILANVKLVILKFMDEYRIAKREKNIIDFNDIEHYALNILVEKNKDGKYVPTDVANEYKKKFEEIAIDEYQDSNLVQEYILTTISRDNNVFMVGDIKQSIYKFRQARLELFLEKYNTYKEVEENIPSYGTKIKLFQNFRSRENIIDVTNLVFEDLMSEEIGNVEYNKDEYLNLGATFENVEGLNCAGKAELHIIDASNEEEINENLEIKDNVEIEADFVACKIKEIIEGNYFVYDKKTKKYRKATFKDIVILLRTTSNTAPIYEKKIAMLNYPVFCDTAQNYFETIEIQTIISLLKIIDNPNNDIPLLTVLRSPIVGLTDNELVEIRVKDKSISFYDALYKSRENIKVDIFLNLLEDLRKKQEYLKLDELLWHIYEITGYYNYVSLMPDGNLKIANLKMLFEKAKDYEQGSFKGLYNFINFIDRISKKGSDMGAPKLIGENENVVRIMSIHKSKGLEFPIVFLSGTGKQFNEQDLRENILLHQDLGFGPKYMNYERRIEYSTLAKEAMIMNLKKEMLSEEMRLLYVALTRSREKLIITGIDKNLSKSLKEKEELLEINTNRNKISKYAVSKAKSYLDWLEMISIFDEKLKNIIDIEYHKKQVETEKEEEKKNSINIETTHFVSSEINEALSWEYPDKELSKIEGKSSVSKIAKEMKTELKIGKPKFLDEIVSLSKAEIGTTVHLVMQKLNFNEEYDENKINELLENLVIKNIISNTQKEAVDIGKILKFTKSNLFSKIRNAELIFKEEPFYINIPAKEIYKNDIEEKILVQGIIDLYFIDKSGEIILIDYKTDYVPEKNEQYLVDKYKKQLGLYKRALEGSLKKPVKEVYIYSTFLDKEIEIY